MGELMNSEKIEITLEAHGQCLYSIAAADIRQDITIGRADDCIWRLPETDKVASSHHAVIRKTPKSILLLDTGSKNGIFCEGKKVSEIILSVGKHISIADAELIVSKHDESKVICKNGEHVLECVNGKHKGETIPIKKNIFSIGAAANNDLVIAENLISQHHAELRVDDSGSCWIQDLKSTNGTLVNHSILPGRKERMLKDGDIISLAHVDFRFLDKNVKHIRSFVGLKILAAIITIALLVSGYFIYLAVTPNACDLIQKARNFAYKADFNQARTILESASSARDISKFQAERDSLLEQIATWELTLREWHHITQCLKEKKWVEAVRSLSSIRADRMESWNWNEDVGGVYKTLAIRTKNNIDLFLQAKGVMGNPDSSISDLRELERKLREMLDAEKNLKPEPVLTELAKGIEELHRKLSENLRNHDRLDETLAPLTMRAPKFSKIVNDLEEIEKSSQGVVKRQASEYLKPIRKLQNCQDGLLTDAVALTNLEFEKIKLDLALPSVDECSIHPLINTQRNTIIRINDNFVSAYKQVLHMHNVLKEWKITPPEKHELLADFTDRQLLEKVLSCDSLRMKLPGRNRKIPQGLYDKMLGIEYFHEFLRNLPGKYDNAVLDRMNFVPECVSMKKLCEQYDDFIKFVEQPDNSWLLHGRLRDLRDYCADQLKLRDSLLVTLRKDPSEPLSRRSILCRGLVIYFSPADKLEKKFYDDFVSDFRKLRETIAIWNNAYETASPEKAIEIRGNILQTGLPGDPIVRRMWATLQ